MLLNWNMRTGHPCPSNPVSELVRRSKHATTGGCLNGKGSGENECLVALAGDGSGYGVGACIGHAVAGVLYGYALGKGAGDCKAVIYALLVGVGAVHEGDAGNLCLGILKSETLNG